MRFRDVSSNVKAVQYSLERTALAYNTSTTAGNGVGDLMRKWAYILEQCAKALDNKEAKILQSGEAPVQQLKAEISGVLDSMQHHVSGNNYRTMQFYINEIRQKLSAV